MRSSGIRPSCHSREQHGFTLIEVLVALTIAALGLAVVGIEMQANILTAERLRDRTMATYVATNALTELRLNADFPEVGRSTDEVEHMNRQWGVEITVTETGIEGLRRADIAVTQADAPTRERREAILSNLSGFVTNRPPLAVSARPSFDSIDAQPGGPGN